MILIKNVVIYSPKFIGKKDIFICNGKIVCIAGKFVSQFNKCKDD